MPLSYIEISTSNLIANFLTIKSSLHPRVKVVCVVKANAYGHGLIQIGSILDEYADYFQVDDIEELKILRKITNKPILVLGYVSKGNLEEAVAYKGILAIYEQERLKVINSIGAKFKKIIPIHIAIDTFLGREGIMPDETLSFITQIKRFPYIKIDGIYAHFANIEDTNDFTHAQKQISTYMKVVTIFKKNGFNNILTHISATSGILVYESNIGINNLVRPGIGLYGLWPSEGLKMKYQHTTFQLAPVLRWVTHVAQVKDIPKNHSIGYGLTYVTLKNIRVALIPQGYSDGYDRELSNVGEVLIHNTRCCVLGRIAMNMFVVDISHIKNVLVEDEVILLGMQGKEIITAEEIASKSGTINYEVVARISSLIPRIVV